MNGKINTVMYDDFDVLDSTGARVAGLVDGGFTKKLYNPSGTEVSGSITVTVTALGSGSYRASYTPNAVGTWKLEVYHATYFPEGKTNTHQIYTNDVDSIAAAVWAVATRTLTSFGTLAADVWSVATRTLTSYGTLAADIATAVWGAGVRTLTSFGTLIADIWAYATRTLSAFAFSVTVGTNNDKTGYSISGTKQTLDSLNDITADSVWSVATRTLTSFGTLITDIWANSARTLTSFGTLIADIWSYVTRTLTAGSGLTKQEVRDAMALATAETPATGSVDKYIADISEWTELIKDIESGGWEITDNQMIFYKPDNITELFRVDLTKAGVPSEIFPDKRTRV